MRQCFSCKNRHSYERCSATCVGSTLVCGRHAKCRNIRFWHKENKQIEQAILRIQSVWRGHAIRKLLRLAGPGVLNRKVCHNEEELTTCVEKERQNPLDYFAINEKGTIWWFDQRTIFQWSHKNLEITNPYTRQPLSIEDRKRLRELYVLRLRRGKPAYHSPDAYPTTVVERRDLRWLRIAQILHEHDFTDLRHENFLSLNRGQIYGFVDLFLNDLRWWTHQVPGRSHSRQAQYLVWMQNMSKMFLLRRPEITQMSYELSGVLLSILNDCRMTHDICFYIVSAYLRVSMFVPMYGL
jgi:hypothetical protein